MKMRFLQLGLISLAMIAPWSFAAAQTAPAAEPKKDEPKKEESKKDEPKKEEPKKDEATKEVTTKEVVTKEVTTKEVATQEKSGGAKSGGAGSSEAGATSGTAASGKACKADRECGVKEVCESGTCVLPGGPLAESKPASVDGSKEKDDVDRYGRTHDDVEENLEDMPARENYYLGARFRNFIVPGFFFDLFADGGPSAVNVFSGGPEFVMQNGALYTAFSITVPYADFSMDPFVFKSKKDDAEAFEMVSSSLKLITVSADIMGRIPIDKKERFSVLIGGGVGISGVLGGLTRNQVYPNNPADRDPDDPSKWTKCKAPGDPGITAPSGNRYCGDDNDHYGNYSEASWANGGSKPFIFPYLALPHLAFEIRPIQELSIRIDSGLSVTGFFFGLGAGGRLPI